MWQIIRTGVGGFTPISTQIYRGISETSTPDSSDSNGTRIPIGTCGTSTDPPDGDLWIPGIGNIRQSATPNLINSGKLDAAIDGKFTNNLDAPPISNEVFSEKLFNNSIMDIYVRLGIHLTTDPVNTATPQFMDTGFSTIDVLDYGAGIWIPATKIRRSPDAAH